MNYRDLLRLPQWQKRRLQRLDLAGWRCEKCSTTERELHVHHKQYVRGRTPWEYADDELEVLCDACHADEHGRPAPRRANAHPPKRTPADRIAWMLLLESGWWKTLSGVDHAALCALPGWHGELFRFLDRQSTERGAQPWAALRECLVGEPWAATALALVDGEDPAIEPLPDDLPRSIAQLVEAPHRAHHMRILGQL